MTGTMEGERNPKGVHEKVGQLKSFVEMFPNILQTGHGNR